MNSLIQNAHLKPSELEEDRVILYCETVHGIEASVLDLQIHIPVAIDVLITPRAHWRLVGEWIQEARQLHGVWQMAEFLVH